MANIIIGLIVLIIFAFAIRSVIKNKKSGGCNCGCGGSDSGCNICHDTPDKK